MCSRFHIYYTFVSTHTAVHIGLRMQVLNPKLPLLEPRDPQELPSLRSVVTRYMYKLLLLYHIYIIFKAFVFLRNNILYLCNVLTLFTLDSRPKISQIILSYTF